MRQGPEDKKGSHLNIWTWNVLSKGKSKTKAFQLEYTWHTERPVWLGSGVRGVGGEFGGYSGHMTRALNWYYFLFEGNGKAL